MRAVLARPPFEWIGGHVALDYVNTVTWTRSGCDRERIRSYQDVLAWSHDAGILAQRDAARLKRLSHRRVAAAAAAYRDAIRMRTEHHSLFVSQVSRQPPVRRVLGSLNRRLQRAVAHLELHATADGVTVGWDEGGGFDRPLWPLLKATVELLESPTIDQLRMCANPDCGWLFLDRSRKRNRRWCSMRECGSRAKARAYYHRQRTVVDRTQRE